MRLCTTFFYVLFFILACSGKKNEKEVVQANVGSLGYQFNEPSEVFKLPEELEEISGLATVSENYLLCNEDEEGKLYLFNIREAAVEKRIKWGKDGDYEGAAIIDGDAYVVKSNGTIYKIGNFQSEKPVVSKINTGISEGCDAEGLTHLPGKNSLLIACKEGGSGTRNIYEYKLENETVRAELYLQLDLTEIEKYFITTGLDKVSLQLRKMLDPKGNSGVLFPSGIAIHPKTGDLYVLSSKSKLLVVYSKGVLKEAVELTHELYRQPEAITFTPNGDLYIGNEANGEKANILKFVYDQQ